MSGEEDRIVQAAAGRTADSTYPRGRRSLALPHPRCASRPARAWALSAPASKDGRYSVLNLFDGEPETTWVEGEFLLLISAFG